jgi:hypothetical protein
VGKPARRASAHRPAARLRVLGSDREVIEAFRQEIKAQEALGGRSPALEGNVQEATSGFIVSNLRAADRQAEVVRAQETLQPIRDGAVGIPRWMAEASEDIRVEKELHRLTRGTKFGGCRALAL